MELSFKKGNYDQFMNMVNASKELLNDSIILRSIKENIDKRIATINQDNQEKTDISLILALAIPLLALLIHDNFLHGFSWRLIPGLGLIGFFIIYRILTRDSQMDNQLISHNIHNDDPRPLKYLGMKIDYLASIASNKKTSLELVRAFYIIFFPLLCFFTYEVAFRKVPFDNIFFGLLASFIIGGIFWYFFFKRDFNQIFFFQKQLMDYKHLINQHNTSLLEEE